MFQILLLLSVHFRYVLGFSENPRVILGNGNALVGTYEGGVAVFRGIPYAPPPVGENRWTPPGSPPKWTGWRNFFEFGNKCVQLATTIDGNEDCLFLNVYTPETFASVHELPVLVWIHGGGYEDGSSNDYDAINLVSKSAELGQGVIVVTVNYRLSVFGFLGGEAMRSRDPSSSSVGNYGIQDQRAALRWVKDNAVWFGGSQNNLKITIFGESAGAGSVSCHISMPKSAPFFQSAIIESGSFSTWVAQPMSESQTVYNQILNATDCADVACLVKVPTDKLVQATLSIPAGRCCDTAGQAYIPWAPTIDGVELVDHPWHLLKQGNINKVPVMHGVNLDEGSLFMTLPTTVSERTVTDTWQTLYGDVLGPDTADKLRSLYITNSTYPQVPGVTDAWWAAQRSAGDQAFSCSARFTSETLSTAGLPVYQYLFSAVSSWGLPVAYHGIEIGFVFHDTANLTPEEQDLSSVIVSAWYNFAMSSDPNQPSTLAQQLQWPEYGGSKGGYLNFNVASAGGISVEKDFKIPECDFLTPWIVHALDDTD